MALWVVEGAYQVTLVVENLPANAGDVQDVGWEDLLQEDMATLPSIIAWSIPADRRAWQSTGSQSVGQDCSNVEGFPGGSDSKEAACNAEDSGLIPGLGRCPGERNGNPLQYPCLENSMDRGAWRATIRGVAKSWTQLSNCKEVQSVHPKKKSVLNVHWKD